MAVFVLSERSCHISHYRDQVSQVWYGKYCAKNGESSNSMSRAFCVNFHIVNRYSCHRKNLGVYFHIYRSIKNHRGQRYFEKRITAWPGCLGKSVAYKWLPNARNTPNWTFFSPTFEFKYYSLWRKHCDFPFRLFNRYKRVRQQSLFERCNMCRSSERIQMQLCDRIYGIKLRNKYGIEYTIYIHSSASNNWFVVDYSIEIVICKLMVYIVRSMRITEIDLLPYSVSIYKYDKTVLSCLRRQLSLSLQFLFHCRFVLQVRLLLWAIYKAEELLFHFFFDRSYELKSMLFQKMKKIVVKVTQNIFKHHWSVWVWMASEMMIMWWNCISLTIILCNTPNIFFVWTIMFVLTLPNFLEQYK